MLLLHCNNGIVIAWHDAAQIVDPSQYGTGTRIIPYDLPLDTLPKVGTPLSDPRMDSRPYAQPAETTALLLAYSAQARWNTVTNGIAFNAIPLNSDRLSQTLIASLAQYAATLPTATNIDFTQDGVAYQITAQDAIDMNNQLSNFIQQCRSVEAGCISDLNSSVPTIKTYDDVDARFSGLRARNLKANK